MITSKVIEFVESLGLRRRNQYSSEWHGPCVFRYADGAKEDGCYFNTRLKNGNGGFYCRYECYMCKLLNATPQQLYCIINNLDPKNDMPKAMRDLGLTPKIDRYTETGKRKMTDENNLKTKQTEQTEQTSKLSTEWQKKTQDEIKKSCERLIKMPIEAKRELVNIRNFTKEEILELAELNLLGWEWSEYKHCGIVCPIVYDETIYTVNCRIKRGKEFSSQRWYNAKGGMIFPLILKSKAETGSLSNNVTVITEGAIDALYLWQATSKQFNIIAILGAGQKHNNNKILSKFLENQEVILVALDSDEVGERESKNWLKYQQATRLTPEFRKEFNQVIVKGAGDMPRDKVNFWVCSGIFNNIMDKHNKRCIELDIDNYIKPEVTETTQDEEQRWEFICKFDKKYQEIEEKLKIAYDMMIKSAI